MGIFFTTHQLHTGCPDFAQVVCCAQALKNSPVSAKKATTHTLIDKRLLIYKRERSNVWQCRVSIDGSYQRVSTGTSDLAEAKEKAHELYLEAQFRKKNKLTPNTRYFRDVAKHALNTIDKDLASNSGKAIYREYKVIINKYLIEFFGKYHIDNIDYALLEKFDEWRAEKMGKVPTYSTVLNHNAALKRVFDEAVYRRYAVESRLPKLVAKGKKSERRAEFTLDEIRIMRQSFDPWIELARADQRDLRALLRDYVNVLLDTGARPGKELLNLKWIQLEMSMKPSIKQTGVIDNTDDEHDEIFLFQANRAVILNIQESKTKARKAIGRQPTIKALEQIAQRNFGKALTGVLKEKREEYIFQFPAYINPKKVGKVKRKAGFIRPTSFPKLFENFLEDHNLLIDPITGKDRPLYCLRHTYATLALAHDKVHIHTLAKQMGTSVKMIEQHYSHLDAVKAIDQLRGDESRELINTTVEISDKHKYKPPVSPRSNKSKKTK